jgi:hypothetical protein
VAPRRAVGARGGDRVECVRDGDHARADRDVVAGEAVGVAGAVDALVVMADDRGQLAVAERDHHRGAVSRVALDQRELGVGQVARLGQDRPRHVDLADVVHQRGGADLGDLLARQANLASDPLCVAGDAPAVTVGVGVAGLEQRAHPPQQRHAVLVGRGRLLDLAGGGVKPPFGDHAPGPAPQQQVAEDQVARLVVAAPEGGEPARQQDREHHRREYVQGNGQRRARWTKLGDQKEGQDGYDDRDR